jgi:hypothetical protein
LGISAKRIPKLFISIPLTVIIILGVGERGQVQNQSKVKKKEDFPNLTVFRKPMGKKIF